VDVWYGAEDTVELGVAEDVFITIPRGTYEQIEAELEVPRVIEAPLAAGERLGELRLALHGESILNVHLISLDTVEEAGLFTRLWHAVYLAFSDLLNSE
jgi:D-alanyl-D-alanine carboxypeptidase (penicillin-binding protein 5/6)